MVIDEESLVVHGDKGIESMETVNDVCFLHICDLTSKVDQKKPFLSNSPLLQIWIEWDTIPA